MVDTTKATLRFLGWLLAGLMLLNFVVAMSAYGTAPAYLVLGGLALASGLAWTNPTVRRWLS
jgi:hypothetical protein